jgi:hypothetical protein
VNAPGTFLSPPTRLSSHPQERPASRHGSSNTQLYYLPADDARGLGIITETSESSASLAVLSPHQTTTSPLASADIQTQTLPKTRLARDGVTTPLSLPYISIAEAVKKRAVEGLAQKTTESDAPDAAGRVTAASSSFASLLETSVS